MANLELALAPTPTLPAWLTPIDAVASMNAALNTTMHRERWKYTKAQPVLDLLAVKAQQPRWDKLPDNISLRICEHDGRVAPLAFDIDAAPEACSALCYQDQIHVLDVNGETDQPVTITHSGHTTPIVIRLAENASLDLRELYDNDEQQHQTLWIELANGSRLTHSRNSFNVGCHWQFLHVNIERDATYCLHNHSGGAQLRRQDIQIVCAGPGARAEIASAAFVAPGSHLDQQVTVEHRAPHSSSTQAFHNIAGNKAKVTFNGRIHIHAAAPGVDAHLSNKNLGLGDQAVINTKPELEIYTDDVSCSHGATVGQLDDEHMFYCASRGIGPVQARNLLSQAFLNVCTQGPLAVEAHGHFEGLAHGRSGTWKV